MPQYAKNWAIPGGDDPTPTGHADTMDKAHVGSIGEGVGNYSGTIGTPSISTTENPQSLPGD